MVDDGAESLGVQLERLLYTLISRATGGAADDAEYRRLRARVLSDPRTSKAAPSFLRACRDLDSFWAFIKPKFASYQERRQFLREALEPCLTAVDPLNAGALVHTVDLSLGRLDSTAVQTEWDKAVTRQASDPDGAITIARTLVESVCKHILHDLGETPDDKSELPKLFHRTSEMLNLAPSQHAEHAVKAILGGCASVANGLAELRNKLGDAHGKQAGSVRAQPRHARLAVNVAGSLALFLVETWEARRATCKQPPSA